MAPSLEIEVLRGQTPESRHFVDAVVTDEKGQLIEAYGPPDALIYARSMIKPIQALPFVLSGAPSDSPDAEKAIAISCASHASELIHLDFIREWHKRLGLETESVLACGPQPPDDETVYFEMIRAFEKPKRINNNCSGKHTGFIATAIKRGLSHAGYERYDHPIQVEVRAHLSRWSGVDVGKAPWGIDGCGIPTYALPQVTIARMMSAMHAPELSEIREACARHPYMVGGHDWVCSEINAATGGRIFAKVGAEGNYALVLYDEGKTIVLKSKDGSFRAAEAALVPLLERHARLKPEELKRIRAVATPPLRNWAGTETGEIRSQPARL